MKHKKNLVEFINKLHSLVVLMASHPEFDKRELEQEFKELEVHANYKYINPTTSLSELVNKYINGEFVLLTDTDLELLIKSGVSKSKAKEYAESVIELFDRVDMEGELNSLGSYFELGIMNGKKLIAFDDDDRFMVMFDKGDLDYLIGLKKVSQSELITLKMSEGDTVEAYLGTKLFRRHGKSKDSVVKEKLDILLPATTRLGEELKDGYTGVETKKLQELRDEIKSATSVSSIEFSIHEYWKIRDKNAYSKEVSDKLFEDYVIEKEENLEDIKKGVTKLKYPTFETEEKKAEWLGIEYVEEEVKTQSKFKKF